MTFRSVAQTTEAHLRFQDATNLMENVPAYRWTGSPPSDAELLALGTELDGTLVSRLCAVQTNGVTYREIYCRNIDTAIANEATFISSRQGGVVGIQEAANVAASLTKRTGYTGRSHHGAMRVGPFQANAIDGNTLTSGLMSGLANVCVSVLTPRVSGRFVSALASRKLGISIALTQCLAQDNNVDSQKTRLNGRGR